MTLNDKKVNAIVPNSTEIMYNVLYPSAKRNFNYILYNVCDINDSSLILVNMTTCRKEITK